MKSRKPLVIRKTSKKKKWFLRGLLASFLVVLVGGGAAWYFLAGPGNTNNNFDPTSILNQVISVQKGDVAITASGSGTLVAKQTADLSFSTSGTVVELNVKVGDMVKSGDVLAKLGEATSLEAELSAAKLELLEAQNSLNDLQNNANLELATAYQDWITAKETYADELTASERTAYARCSQEVVTKYAAALDNAKSKLEDLRATSYGTDAWINAQYDLDTAQANYDYCASYTSDEKTNAKSSLEVAKLEMDQAETKYNTLKDNSGVDPDELLQAEATVDTAQAEVDAAEETLDGITLIAPIDGKVTYLASSEGKIVDTSTFITISDVVHPTISVSVDETDIDKFSIGNSATVVFDALPDVVFSGEVVQVDPSLTSYNQYAVAKGLIELNSDAVKTVQDLPLGLNASVTITSQEAKDVLVVPATAVKGSSEKGYTVMVEGADGQMTSQSVEVGLQNDDYVQITSGLTEGEKVSSGVTVSQTGSSNSSDQQNQMMGGFDGGMPPDGGGMMGPP